MPDSIGRYQFSEMAKIVRNSLSAIQKTVNTSTGEELTSTITNQLISNTDILAAFNRAIVGLYTDIMLAKPDVFVTEVPVSIQAYVINYAFPVGMLDFTAMMWKRQSVPVQPQPGPSYSPHPDDYIEMVQIDNPHDYNEQVGRYSAPTWRRIGQNFQLNCVPTQSNSLGILVRGVFLPPALADDLASPTPPVQTTYLQGPLPTLCQELIMLEAIRKLGLEKLNQEPTNIDADVLMWRSRVDNAIRNMQAPRSVQLTSSRLVQMTYSGRRRGFYRGGF